MLSTKKLHCAKFASADPMFIEPSDFAWARMAPLMHPIALPGVLKLTSNHAEDDDDSRPVIVEHTARDLLRSDCDVVLHCCNCFHKMGCGIADAIRKKYPRAYEADCATPYGDRRKLGHYSSALCTARSRFDTRHVTIVNLYAQYDYRGGQGGRRLCYSALEVALERFLDALDEQDAPPSLKIGTYWLGCTHSGGDPDIVRQILRDAFSLHKRQVHIYSFP